MSAHPKPVRLASQAVTADPERHAAAGRHGEREITQALASSRMRQNRSVPPVTVVPILAYPDVRAAVAWLSAAFGFVERTRIGERHRSQLSIGSDGAVIVAEARDDLVADGGSATQATRVRVERVDATFEQARANGARILEPPTDREYGERDFTVEDLAGHRWQFAETIRDVAPEEYGCQTVAPWPQVGVEAAGD